MEKKDAQDIFSSKYFKEIIYSDDDIKLQEFFNQLSKTLLKHLDSTTLCKEQKEDVTQTVIEKVYKHRKRIRHLKSYVKRVLRSKISEIAREKRIFVFEDKIQSHELFHILGFSKMEPDDIIIKKEEEKGLWENFRELKKLDKYILVRKNVKNDTYKDISKELDTSITYIYLRHKSALKHLEKCLKGKGLER